jgi:hypothetical protein
MRKRGSLGDAMQTHRYPKRCWPGCAMPTPADTRSRFRRRPRPVRDKPDQCNVERLTMTASDGRLDRKACAICRVPKSSEPNAATKSMGSQPRFISKWMAPASSQRKSSSRCTVPTLLEDGRLERLKVLHHQSRTVLLEDAGLCMRSMAHISDNRTNCKR